MATSVIRWIGLIGAVCMWADTATAQSRTLDIYWVDVEGGAATLVVSPTGESLLVDTGFPQADNRDAKRIFAATQEAGLTRIDYLVMTHFHRDHAGGLQALAEMIPIEKCLDHGTNTEESNQQWVDAYLSVCGDKRAAVEAGEKIPFGDVEIDVIASDGRLITSPVNAGRANPLCATAERKPQASPENQRSVGALFTYGRFTFLDLGDFNWAKEVELSCPTNLVGEVTLYQTSRHAAFDDAGSPTHLYAMKPQVVVVNNGPRKGLGGTSPGFEEVSTAHYERIAQSPGIEGIWQGHRSLLDPDPAHNTAEEMIANLEDTDECEGHWIRASVSQDGTFTVTNSRNGFSQTYTARGARVPRVEPFARLTGPRIELPEDPQGASPLRQLCPEVSDTCRKYWAYTINFVDNYTIPLRDKELLILRTAWLSRGDYVWGRHNLTGQRAGLTDEEIRRITTGPDAVGWGDFDAALLRAADELHMSRFVSEPTWNVLAQRYTQDQMVEVVLIVGNYTQLTMFQNTLGAQLPPDVEGLPERP